MELDDLKALWATVEKSRVLDERILRELTLGRVRSTLRPGLVMRAFEVAFGLAMLVLCAPVVVAQAATVRYLLFGIPSLVFIGAMTATSAHLLVRVAQLAYDGPLLAMQREVAALRRLEVRATLSALLGGVVLWLPIGLLLFEALTGVPLLRAADLAWLLGNVAVGLVLLGIGRAVARRYLEGAHLGPRAERIVDALTGRGLRAAAARLAELAQYAE